MLKITEIKSYPNFYYIPSLSYSMTTYTQNEYSNETGNGTRQSTGMYLDPDDPTSPSFVGSSIDSVEYLGIKLNSSDFDGTEWVGKLVKADESYSVIATSNNTITTSESTSWTTLKFTFDSNTVPAEGCYFFMIPVDATISTPVFQIRYKINATNKLSLSRLVNTSSTPTNDGANSIMGEVIYSSSTPSGNGTLLPPPPAFVSF